MYRIDPITKAIEVTRGDILPLSISTTNKDGSPYTFQVGDVIRFKVFEKKGCDCVVIQKDTIIETPSTFANIDLTSEDTKIGELINKHVDYWYEVELNPDTVPQTIIGYEIDKVTRKPLEKIFTLLPEGGDKK